MVLLMVVVAELKAELKTELHVVSQTRQFLYNVYGWIVCLIANIILDGSQYYVEHNAQTKPVNSYPFSIY